MELICFEIIANAGSAKSGYIEAMRYARKLNFEKAEELIEESKKSYLKAHDAHQKLVVRELSGEKVDMSLILMHTEDQLMSADNFRIICEEHIELIKMLKGINEED